MDIHNPVLWVTVAFVIFIALAWKPVGKVMSKGLDDRSERIKKELTDATSMREEAQAMLADYEKKKQEVEAESEKILKNAKVEATRLQDEAKIKIEESIKRRIAEMNKKIADEEERAIQDVQKQVVLVAVSAAREILSDSMNNELDDSMLKLAIKDIDRIAH